MRLRKRPRKLPRIIFCLLMNASSAVFVFMLYSNKLLPANYMYGIIGILVLINIVIDFVLIRRKSKKACRIISYIALIVVLLTTLAGSYALYKGVSALNEIFGDKDSLIKVSLIVMKDSPIKEASQIKGLDISSVASQDDIYIDKIAKDLSVNDVIDAESYPKMIIGLYSGESKIIVVNESYRGLIKTINTDFDDKTVVIKQYTFKNPHSKTRVNLISDSSPFNIYVNGVDLSGLSDVNIVASIDPIEKKMLLTTIPRDSYLPIALGGNDKGDKLTHSGIYGVDSTVATVENLLDIQIDGYVQVDFDALMNIVDVLDGVDVDNPVAFSSTGELHYFNRGVIHLNGEQALIYSRERQSLQDGDNDRGKNQERVITAIFNKIIKPENLVNYNNILSALGDSVKTNIGVANISKLISMQLEYGGNWSIDANSISGKGVAGLESYAMPGYYLYFTELSKDSIKEAKSKINRIIR